MVNLSAFIRSHAIRTPDKIALIYDGQRITYAEFHDRIEKMARFLASKGIGAGDIVAALMKNSAAFLEVVFATSYLGAVFLPINFRLSRDECTFIVTHAGAKILMADEELAASAAGAKTIFLPDDAQHDSRVLGGGTLPAVPANARLPADLFRLMYTSGTTDRPKGVIHSYGNFYWKSMDHVIALGLNAHDRLLAVGPLYHVGAFDLPGIAVLWVGGSMVIFRQFEESELLSAIEREKITCAWLAPTMVSRLLAFGNPGGADLSTFKWCIAGGEKTPEGRIREFAELFTSGRFIDGFGLTETCSGDTLMDAGYELVKIGSTGRALAHVELEIRDEHGTPLPRGAQGEICVRGPKVTKGYWKDPDKTAASFFGDWFRTGDVGYLDPEGFLYVTDRKKDMIISGGENIASSEIERVIYELPGVAECAVVGVVDEKWGERPLAVVVVAQGARLTSEAVLAQCKSSLASFKVPKSVVFRDLLPRNPSGKVLKRTLRDELTQAGEKAR